MQISGLYMLHDIIQSAPFQYQCHGQKEWRNEQLSEDHMTEWNKNGQFIKYIQNGQVIAKNDITKIENKCVTFADGSFVDNIDVIFFCGGYVADLEYLKIDKSFKYIKL